ncbi:MAG: type II secretion system protein [Verrucomicrobiaceae bacterium]|nr:type II secretion system protein [Verrucomicrobiaceae bacterium]
MKQMNNRGFTLIELLVVITIIALIAGMALPAMNNVTQNARMTTAGNNARQIVVSLKSYAGDNQGLYPDFNRKDPPQTSNDAFRLLIRGGMVEDERIFTAPASPYVNDNDVGEAPDYQSALEPGENHWCMTKGLSDSASGNAPLVFENPVSTSWPPTWNCDAAGQPKEGRAWKGGKIVIALNDGSVSPQKLDSPKGDNVSLETNESGKDLFTQYSEQGEFLDIQRD